MSSAREVIGTEGWQQAREGDCGLPFLPASCCLFPCLCLAAFCCQFPSAFYSLCSHPLPISCSHSQPPCLHPAASHAPSYGRGCTGTEPTGGGGGPLGRSPLLSSAMGPDAGVSPWSPPWPRPPPNAAAPTLGTHWYWRGNSPVGTGSMAGGPWGVWLGGKGRGRGRCQDPALWAASVPWEGGPGEHCNGILRAEGQDTGQGKGTGHPTKVTTKSPGLYIGEGDCGGGTCGSPEAERGQEWQSQGTAGQIWPPRKLLLLPLSDPHHAVTSPRCGPPPCHMNPHQSV